MISKVIFYKGIISPRIMTETSRKTRKITLDAESVQSFIKLIENPQWTEKDLDRFVSTRGIQFLLQQEKESGPNFSENTVKTYLRRIQKGFSGEQGGWEIAWKERSALQERLTHLLENWDDFVSHCLSVSEEYTPNWAALESTCHILPGGFRESYSDSEEFAINMGHGEKTDPEWMFSIGYEGFHCWLTRVMGERHRIKDCRTPSEFVEAFLDITHREGLALLVGLKAAGIEEQFTEEYATDLEREKKMYARVFEYAVEGRAPKEIEWIQKVFSGYTSPSALLGFQMAKVLDESDETAGHSIGKNMLQGSVTKLGFVFFFELYRYYGRDSPLFPEIVWNAFQNLLQEKGIGSVGEGFFPL